MSALWVSFGELCEIMGQEAAERLCAIYGGLSFYVPKRPWSETKLAAIIGHKQFAALARIYGGGEITIPNRRGKEPAKAKIIELIEAGKGAREIAIEMGVTQRYVESLAKGSKKRTGLLRLPGL